MTEINWHRVFAISSLLFAMSLIGGSVYLHLRHKHHLGRLNYSPSSKASTSPSASVVAASTIRRDSRTHAPTDEPNIFDDALALDQYSSDSDSESGSGSSEDGKGPLAIYNDLSAQSSQSEDSSEEIFKNFVSEACLECICETTTTCSPSNCGDTPCGIFRISHGYWIDAGQLEVEGDESHSGYTHCVNNPYCSGRTVTAFVKRYARDCNGDGTIDCRDHIALHVLGPSGCIKNELGDVFKFRMENCLSKFE